MTTTYKRNGTRRGSIVMNLWTAFGTEPFTVADAKIRLPPDQQCNWGTTMRDLVGSGYLIAIQDGERWRNGQARPSYTFTSGSIVMIKRSLGEQPPVCAELSSRGRMSAVKKFFHDRCIHCDRPLSDSNWLMVGTMVLPVCRKCANLVRDGDQVYWNTCLESLIRNKHGGKWRLEGSDLVTKCGTTPPDRASTAASD